MEEKKTVENDENKYRYTNIKDTDMAKKLGSIRKNGLRILLHSGEEIFICISAKKTAYITDPKDAEELGRWLIQAAKTMTTEKKKERKK